MIGKVTKMIMKDGKEQHYTFIKGEDGKEYFLHISAMGDEKWHEMSALVSAGGATVHFEPTITNKGTRAEHCVLMS